jgi:hypothetical protein
MFAQSRLRHPMLFRTIAEHLVGLTDHSAAGEAHPPGRRLEEFSPQGKILSPRLVVSHRHKLILLARHKVWGTLLGHMLGRLSWLRMHLSAMKGVHPCKDVWQCILLATLTLVKFRSSDCLRASQKLT